MRYIDLPVQLIRQEYRAGASIDELGEKYGVHRQTIYNRLKTYGDIRVQRRSLPIKTVIRRYKNGEPMSAIAADLGVNISVVRSRLVQSGVVIRPVGTYVKRVGDYIDLPDEELVRLYLSGWSLTQLAAKYGVSTRPIVARLSRAGVERRHPSSCRRVVRNKRTGTVLKAASRWEISMYSILHRIYDGRILYDGEFGVRSEFKSPTIDLGSRKWHPDFALPDCNTLIEVKGHYKASAMWDSIIVPAIRTARLSWIVYVCRCDPRQLKGVRFLRELLSHLTPVEPEIGGSGMMSH